MPNSLQIWRLSLRTALAEHGQLATTTERKILMESQKSQRQHAQSSIRGQEVTAPKGKVLMYLSLGALGVVYGDIGTSPLYAFRESFHAGYGIPVTPDNVLGILSLIFWALIMVISVKYLVFVMRADNRGEGGILALTSLLGLKSGTAQRRAHWTMILMGLFGTALLYGDGMITPAISVLSAVEGLEVATPFFQPYIVPITIGILVALFSIQSRGTEQVGKVFGPVMLVWFSTLASLGIQWIVRRPDVLAAINPWHGLDFFLRNGGRGILVLGSVFLVVTGGEALYADMGHFGRRPIRWAWFVVALPALLLNYFGQGALLLENPEAVVNPFYRMAPAWALYPVVIIATIAAVIASQALITGVFSLTMQAIQFGYLPRVRILHTSSSQFGQIYIPAINWTLMMACIALVVAFGSSSNLAAAYGVAVTTTMAITTLLLFIVERERWKWSLPLVLGFTALFLTIDLFFLGANLAKIPAGGWFPLVIGVVVFTLMTTWQRGRKILGVRLQKGTLRFRDFTTGLRSAEAIRVPGTAVFMYSDPQGTPPALLNNLRHNRILHEQVILLSVQNSDAPFVSKADRIRATDLHDGFFSVVLRYGFMENPNVPRDLVLAAEYGLALDVSKISYFLGRERLFAMKDSDMAVWRQLIFAFMSRNANNATDFFQLPPNQVVEMGTQVEM